MGFFKHAISTTHSRGFPTTSVSQGSPLLLVQTAASTFTNRSREDADRAMGDRAPLPNFGFCNLTLFPALRRREEGTFHQASQWLGPLGAPGQRTPCYQTPKFWSFSKGFRKCYTAGCLLCAPALLLVKVWRKHLFLRNKCRQQQGLSITKWISPKKSYFH